jgi:SAM-dependent methyltransferase
MDMNALRRSMGSVGKAARRFLGRREKRGSPPGFTDSAEYWEQRYATGGNSGAGSYNKLAVFKAEVINGFVQDCAIKSVIEYGCGDGNQLKLARYPAYLGFDVSQTAVRLCQESFKTDASKSFRLMETCAGERADLALSLDVIYHLVEDSVFEAYMRQLFGSADRYVIIYSSNTDDNTGREAAHVRHRQFTKWVADHMLHWKLVKHVRNRYPSPDDHRKGSFAEFYVYQRIGSPAPEE